MITVRPGLAGPLICIHRIQHTVAIKYYQLCSFQIISLKFVFQTLSQNCAEGGSGRRLGSGTFILLFIVQHAVKQL